MVHAYATSVSIKVGVVIDFQWSEDLPLPFHKAKRAPFSEGVLWTKGDSEMPKQNLI